MKKIRYKLLARSVPVFALLTAVLVSVLLAVTFEKSLESERAYAVEKLSACIKTLQSAYAGYAMQGAEPDGFMLQSAARQADASAKVEKVSFETASETRFTENTLLASSDARLGNSVYRVSIERDVSGLYALRENFLRIYRALYLLFLPAGMLFMYTAGRSITRPVEALTRASDALSKGNAFLRPEIATGDEIETLSHAFNRMADAVQSEIERRETLIGNLTHEMKTPLQAIIGYADLIRMDKLENEPRLLAAETIRHEAQRLDRLSRRMMNWMEAEDSKNTILLPVSTTHMLNNLQKAFETRIFIETQCDEAYVMADGVLLETLLINLLDNSLNADAKTILLKAEKQEGKVLFSVTDDGCGMEKETLLHLEEPFYREDKARTRAHGGAGLGLALAARIASLHNTHLNYQSEKGKGTYVEFALTEAEND